uniref:Secreted protein n=1 Tax=Hydatigena taeniaeformis TaxID=6205 RepID=A0A0R3X0U4_HYDTA
MTSAKLSTRVAVFKALRLLISSSRGFAVISSYCNNNQSGLATRRDRKQNSATYSGTQFCSDFEEDLTFYRDIFDYLRPSLRYAVQSIDHSRLRWLEQRH